MTSSSAPESGVRVDRPPVSAAPARSDRGPLAEVGFVVLGLVGYLLVRWYTLDRTDEATANARDVLALEESLALDLEHALQRTTVTSASWLADVATHFYVWGYLPVLVTATIWLYVRHRDHYRTLRNALLASGVVGLVIYALYPVAPPWITDDRFHDTVANASLEAFARPAGIMNELGAMPSFHCAWLTLAAAVVFTATRSRVLRVAAVAWPAFMCFAVVVTGNHWLLDLPAGLALAGLGLLAAFAVSTARRTSTGAGQG